MAIKKNGAASVWLSDLWYWLTSTPQNFIIIIIALTAALYFALSHKEQPIIQTTPRPQTNSPQQTSRPQQQPQQPPLYQDIVQSGTYTLISDTQVLHFSTTANIATINGWLIISTSTDPSITGHSIPAGENTTITSGYIHGHNGDTFQITFQPRPKDTHMTPEELARLNQLLREQRKIHLQNQATCTVPGSVFSDELGRCVMQ
jgi:hypothetical protein